MESTQNIQVAAFYQFADLPDFAGLKPALLACMAAGGVRGTILLAPEGVNGTIAGPAAGVEAVLAHLKADPRLVRLEHKSSWCAAMPFKRAKVRLKREIITFGNPEAADPAKWGGTYVEPARWNTLLADPDVTLLDTRNTYEVAAGTFDGAIDPHIETFKQFAAYVDGMNPAEHPKVAMFCTGGIRCEKASAYMRAKGFKEVYHLKGGILKYLEDVPTGQSRWHGNCFVFDEREGIEHGLKPVKGGESR